MMAHTVPNLFGWNIVDSVTEYSRVLLISGHLKFHNT